MHSRGEVFKDLLKHQLTVAQVLDAENQKEQEQSNRQLPDQLDHLKSVVVGAKVADSGAFEELVFPGLNSAPSFTFSDASTSEFNPDNVSLERHPLSSGCVRAPLLTFVSLVVVVVVVVVKKLLFRLVLSCTPL